MFRRLLVLAVALCAGVAASRTVKVSEKEDLVVAVPSGGVAAAGHEPVLKVVAQDLDRVNVLPYMPENAGRSRGSHRQEDRNGSRGATSSNSPRKPSRRGHSHRRRQKSFQSEGNHGMLNTLEKPVLGQQGVKASFPGRVGKLASAAQRTGIPAGHGPRMQRRNNSKGPAHMSDGGCRAALGKMAYCEAVLRRARMCKTQGGKYKVCCKKQICKNHNARVSRQIRAPYHDASSSSRRKHSSKRCAHHRSRPDRYDRRYTMGGRYY